MLTKVALIVAGFGLIATSWARAEKVEDFIKREVAGKSTSADFDDNFHTVSFIGAQMLSSDRDGILHWQDTLKSTKTTYTVDKLTITSKAESPANDGGGTIICITSKTTVKVKQGDAHSELVQVNDDLIIHDASGKNRLLFSARRQSAP